MRAEFRLLGDVGVRVDGRQVDIGHARQRLVLMALLVDVNRVVTVDQLVERVWGGDAPQRARGTLHSYLSRLRQALAPVVGEAALTRRAGGYVLTADPAAVDLHRFSALSGRARGADDGTAVGLLEEALGLWRGEAFAGEDVPWLNDLRVTLANARRAAELDLTDRKLRLGRHAELLTELAARAAAHPLDERVAGQYILALHRSGRRADALAHYADVRRSLVEELGVDPSPELAALHGRVLRAEDEGTVPPPSATGHVRAATVHTETAHVGAVSAETVNVGTVHVGTVQVMSGPSPVQAEGKAYPAYPLPVADVRPAQLPSGVDDFTGRTSLVAELEEQVGSGASSVVAVAGIGGVGKTTLALHVAHAVRARYPDGQLYADLHGASPSAADPEGVLASFIRALGVPEPAIPDDAEERAALYRSLLSERRVLVVLDNARDAAHVRPLLPGAKGCTALVTSRARLTGLAGAHLVDLEVMGADEALALFAEVGGGARAAEERAAEEVVSACGFLPLAIRIAASRLAARRGWTVALLASKLADERRRLDELRVGDLEVTATFELGYGQLEAEQARAFRLLGVVDGPDLSLPAAAALLERPSDDAEDVLELLVDTSLLESVAPGRYRFHDLVRLFARGKAEAGREDGAPLRMAHFYLATAVRAFVGEHPGDRTVDHLTSARQDGLEFGDRESAIDWLLTESGCLLACVTQLAASERPGLAADLLIAVKPLADRGDYAARFERCALSVCEAAQRAGDTRAEARARMILTHFFSVTGRFSRAEEEAREAARLGAEADDALSRAYAANDLGIITYYMGRHEESEVCLGQAIDAFRKDGNRPSEASALCNLSRTRAALGRYGSAVSLAEQGLAIYHDMGSTFRMGNARYTLGCALTQAGRTDEGLAELKRASMSFRESRQPLWEGVTSFRMAEAYLLAGRAEKAAEHAGLALELRCIGGEWRRATVLVVLGRAYDALGRRDEAVVSWREALEIFEKAEAREAVEVAALLASV
ncbi:BTAD domain-containing putative transcriptional regulator [Streptomyces sp. NPDC048172]|uniref:AfsR/SARP family transcriptional regulator n=1 Tax=Streptomyces sp. NPDC048172 TaxID=3365505 RepID=UPI00371CB015